MEFLNNNPKWIRQPKQVQISEDKVVILTERGTDLWARTYYGFQNDNAPVFQVETTDKYFSFIVKTEFESTCRFDQCGVAMYLNSDNWFKASIEYENKKIQRLGSIVTNHGYSDWATTDISSDIKSMWYIASTGIYINAVALWIVFCIYCSHRIISPYRPINHSLQKLEAFQSVHHVVFILSGAMFRSSQYNC